MLQVKVPFRKLKHIHHISDIQIRNLKRHKEYEEVFNRLYEKVKENKDNAVAYIGGDIAHSKCDMSPELVDQLSRLFKNLSDIVPTIIIAGNHDCNLNNRSRLDVLTPIVNNLNHPNLHYLKDSGVYTCADTKFVVWDCWTDEEDFITSDEVEGDTKVVLFHGTVDKAETDLGFKLPSDVHISKFDGYDLGLLGDIHKRQFVNKEETIAYCGSLVQQNHGEEIGKGYLLWDVPKRTSEYIEIPNDYGYYTINIQDGKLPTDLGNLPKKARLRVKVANTSGTELKKCLAVIQHKHGIKEVVVHRTDILKDKVRDGNKLDLGDVNNPDFQYEMIEEYLNNNFLVDNQTLKKIKNINGELNSSLPIDNITRNVDWKLKRFEFDNMFSYGEDNVVDFTKLGGVVGLFAANASGKSSLLDALCFCLFDTSTRTYSAGSVLNNKKNSFKCKLLFEVNGQNYVVERIAKKARNGHVKVNVDFYTYDDSGEVVSLNGDQRRTTNANIKQVVGTFEDFILTTLSAQNANTVFIDKTQKERKELLAQFMGLGVFDRLYTLANEEISEVQAVLRNFSKTNYDEQLADVETSISELSNDLKDKRKEYKVIEKDANTLQKGILKLNQKIKPIDETVTDINLLQSELKDNQELHTQTQTLFQEALHKISHIESTKTMTMKQLEEFKTENILQKYNELESFKYDYEKTEIDIDKLKEEVQRKLDKIRKLGDLEYDPDCEFCMNNVFVKDARETKKLLEDDKLQSAKLISKKNDLDSKIKDYSDIENKKDQFDKCEQLFEQLNDDLVSIETNRDHLGEKLVYIDEKNVTVEENIKKYYKQEKDVVHNNKVKQDIAKQEVELDMTTTYLKSADKNVKDTEIELKISENKKEEIIKIMDEVQELEEKHVAYKYYLEAVKRDGVPYELISKALPAIENEVNNILSQLVDFTMTFEMDGKNINNYIVYDNDNTWPLDLSSGMERFISSLAIRVGLINVSNLPRGNFLAIDEGWGTMDSENLNSVYNLFQYLKTQFQFTLIVSHIDTMRDAVDTLLEIKKEDGYSSVKLS
jgi:DNA repair exonuclease SbcCD ATPase subunit